MSQVVDVYDAYNKNWVGADTCGTLTTNSVTSTTHSGTFELAIEVREATKQSYAIGGRYGKYIRYQLQPGNIC